MKPTYTTSLNLKSIDSALLFLRIGIALLMLTHGIPKVLSLFNDPEIHFLNPLGLGEGVTLTIAVFAEVVCSILVFMGLGIRLAVIPLILTMLVAIFIVHGADAFGVKELAISYLMIFIFLLIAGAGKFSLSHYILSSKKKEKEMEQNFQ